MTTRKLSVFHTALFAVAALFSKDKAPDNVDVLIIKYNSTLSDSKYISLQHLRKLHFNVHWLKQPFHDFLPQIVFCVGLDQIVVHAACQRLVYLLLHTNRSAVR